MKVLFNFSTGKFDFTETDHTKLSNIGTNTHAQVDTHIANTALNAHGATATADIDFAKFKAIAMCCDNGTSFPASPNTGQWFYRTDIYTLFIYEAAWKAICSFGAVTLYVDGASGSDAVGQGYSSGAGATATIQYAVNLIPPINGGNIIINHNGGTTTELITIQGKAFAGAYTLKIIGTMSETQATATLDQGGDVITTYAAGVQSTITDASQAWSVNGFANKIFRIVGGSGYDSTNTWKNDYIIESNTATVLTLITGAWFTTPVAGGGTPTQYQIVDFASIVDGNATYVNNFLVNNDNVILQNFKLIGSTSSALLTNNALQLQLFTLYGTSTTAATGTNYFRFDNKTILNNCNAVNVFANFTGSNAFSVIGLSKTNIDVSNQYFGVTNSRIAGKSTCVNVGQLSYFWANQSYGNKFIPTAAGATIGLNVSQLGTAAIKNTIVNMTGSTGTSYGVSITEGSTCRFNGGNYIQNASSHGVYVANSAIAFGMAATNTIINNTGFGMYMQDGGSVKGTIANFTFTTNTAGAISYAEVLMAAAGTIRPASHTIEGSATLVAGTVTVTLTSPAAFTSATSYTVNISRTITTALIGVVNNSGSSFTITSANLLDTDTVRFVAIGT